MRTLAWTLLFGLAALVRFSPDASAEFQTLSYRTPDGVQLQYSVAAPSFQTGAKLQLWIFQPGDGTVLDTFDPSQYQPMMEQFTQAFGIALVMPELRRQLYTTDLKTYCQLDFFHRVGDLGALIDATKQLPFVDPAHVLLFGYSAGGEIVTRTAAARAATGQADIWRVATYGTGVVSDGEIPIALPVPANLLNNDCSDPATYAQRSGVFWHQLFDESRLFATIQSLEIPYLAMFGATDTVEPFDANESAYAAKLTAIQPDFRDIVFPGLDHGGYAEGPAVFQAVRDWAGP